MRRAHSSRSWVRFSLKCATNSRSIAALVSLELGSVTATALSLVVRGRVVPSRLFFSLIIGFSGCGCYRLGPVIYTQSFHPAPSLSSLSLPPVAASRQIPHVIRGTHVNLLPAKSGLASPLTAAPPHASPRT